MIKARVKAENPEANLKDYHQTYKTFSWSEAEKEFTWHETGSINIVHEAIDRWAENPDKKEQRAFTFEKHGEVKNFSYMDLKDKSSQWANLLAKYGLRTGDRLFIFLPPCPEIYFAMLACGRMGVLFCNLFSSLSFEELEVRFRIAKPRAILTHPDLAERIPFETLGRMVEYVFLTEGPLPSLSSSEVLLEGQPEKMSKQFAPRWFPENMPLYINYTSGATGPPKGVVHAHHDMVGLLTTARYFLDLREDTILWTDADPAWVTGIAYGAFAPWLCGATSLVQGDPFSASNWYRTLEKHQVSVLYTTPTTIRSLMEGGEDLPGRYDFSHLRHIATVGEPLVPELFYWVKQNLKHSPHDTWGMVETGMICLANFPSMDIKPGSIGKPMPGIEAAILDDNGEPIPPLSMGELALKLGWPSIMSSFWGDDTRYQEYFRIEGWFLTGDMFLKDEEGYYYHQGRIDDLLKAGGDKVIGPYEVEHVLCMHPAVSEAAVISKGTEPGKGESFVKAFITINKGFTPSARLNHEIRAFLKANLSADIIVKEITFLDKIPKSSNGKVIRRALKAADLGLST